MACGLSLKLQYGVCLGERKVWRDKRRFARPAAFVRRYRTDWFSMSETKLRDLLKPGWLHPQRAFDAVRRRRRVESHDDYRSLQRRPPRRLVQSKRTVKTYSPYASESSCFEAGNSRYDFKLPKRTIVSSLEFGSTNRRAATKFLKSNAFHERAPDGYTTRDLMSAAPGSEEAAQFDAGSDEQE